MSDIALSLIIAAVAGVTVILVFMAAARHRLAKEKEMEAYCRDHGFVISKRTDALSREIVIEGEGFTLKSKMVSHRQEETTGSSSWEKETIWVTRGLQRPRPAFALGSVSASMDWLNLPDLVKNADAQKFNKETGNNYSPGHGRIVHKNRTSAFLLFEETPGAANDLLDKVIAWLDAWPGDHPLIIQSSPEEVSIRVTGLFIRDTQQLDRVIRLGQACAG